MQRRRAKRVEARTLSVWPGGDLTLCTSYLALLWRDSLNPPLPCIGTKPLDPISLVP